MPSENRWRSPVWRDRTFPLRSAVCKSGLPAPREWVAGVLPGGCQQWAGLRSLRSLRPLPTSTASTLREDLYPSGPSPCPCPGVDTPARRRIPPSPRVQNGPSCPRGAGNHTCRVQKASSCPRDRAKARLVAVFVPEAEHEGGGE